MVTALRVVCQSSCGFAHQITACLVTVPGWKGHCTISRARRFPLREVNGSNGPDGRHEGSECVLHNGRCNVEWGCAARLC